MLKDNHVLAFSSIIMSFEKYIRMFAVMHAASLGRRNGLISGDEC